MAQGSTLGRVKIVNPDDIKDRDARDILAAILVQLNVQCQLLRLMALDQGIEIPEEITEAIDADA